MIKRSQYRCSFKLLGNDMPLDSIVERCKEKAKSLVENGALVNVSFYRYENMGFLYVESVPQDSDIENESANPEIIMADLKPYLKPWPEEDGDRYFAPMVNVYYHHIPEDELSAWEHERTTDVKTRIGRVAFVFPDKLPSYVMHHKAIVDEGLLKGDKYAYISMHENLLFSYYEEPRNNVNICDSEKESEAIKKWIAADPESHFDRIKAKGENFLVIPCLFSVDRVDIK